MSNKEPINNVDSYDIKSNEYNNDSNIFDKKNNSKQSLINDEHNNNVETADVSKTKNRQTNANKHKLILICYHDINSCNYYKDNNKKTYYHPQSWLKLSHKEQKKVTQNFLFGRKH